VCVPDPEMVVGNLTNTKRIMRGDDDTTELRQVLLRPIAPSMHPHTCTHTLHPLIFPPAFLPSLLLPTTNMLITEPSLSTDQDQSKQKGNDDKATTNKKMDVGSSLTTVTVGGLPPNTLKTDIVHVFQCFGEVTCIFVHPGRHCTDVVFADIESVKWSLHAYVE